MAQTGHSEAEFSKTHLESGEVLSSLSQAGMAGFWAIARTVVTIFNDIGYSLGGSFLPQ